MGEWKEYKLGQLCEIASSKRIFQSEYVSFGIPFYRSKEIIELSDGKSISTELFISKERYNEIKQKTGVPQKGDILLTSVGTLGIPYYVNQDDFYFKDGNLTWFKNFNSKIISKYLYILLKSSFGKEWILSHSIGSSQPALTIDILKKISFSIPEINEQRRIASILSSYDGLIETNNKRIALLEKSARELYKEWFVRFRFPGHEHTKFVKGLPEGWEETKITDLVDIKYGKDHKCLNEGNIPVYGSGGIMRMADRKLCSGESVLIPRKGTLNNIMLVRGDFWTIDTMFYSKAKINYVNKILFFFLSSLDMESFNSGAALPSMTTQILQGIKMALPSLAIREKFENRINHSFLLIDKLKEQNASLSSARDRLLPRLISGKLKV